MRSAAEIERHAEEVRAEMADTAETLQRRLTAGQIIDEVSGYFRDSQGVLGLQNLQRQARDNPMALALVGTGLAWLMMGRGVRAMGGRRNGAGNGRSYGFGPDRRFPDGRGDPSQDDLFGLAVTDPYLGDERYGDAFGGDDGNGSGGSWTGAASDAAGNAASTVKDAAGRAASGARSAASSMSDAAGRTYGGARRGMADAAHRVGDAAASLSDGLGSTGRRIGDEGARMAGMAQRSFGDAMEREPLILGALGLAVGAALGAMLPRTRVEDEYLGPAGDRARDMASTMAEQGLAEAERVVEKTASATKEALKDEGLLPDRDTLAKKIDKVADTAMGTAESEIGKSAERMQKGDSAAASGSSSPNRSGTSI